MIWFFFFIKLQYADLFDPHTRKYLKRPIEFLDGNTKNFSLINAKIPY